RGRLGWGTDLGDPDHHCSRSRAPPSRGLSPGGHRRRHPRRGPAVSRGDRATMTVDVMAQLAIGQQFADLAASGPLLIAILAAAAAGLVSFASPCVVPRVPGYMSYLASIVGGEVQYDSDHGAVVTKKRQWAVAGAAGMFIAGFTVVFVLATVSVF